VKKFSPFCLHFSFDHVPRKNLTHPFNKEENMTSPILIAYASSYGSTQDVFTRKFDPDKLRFPCSLIGPLKKMPPSDERDWDAIQVWAREISRDFQVEER
jgi:hypothetical protein